MKKTLKILSLLLLLSLFLSTRISAADGGYDGSIHRFNCFVDGFVSEAEEKELDDRIFGMIEKYSVDFPVCVFNTLSDEMTLSDYAPRFYAENNFGWGEDADGVLFLIDLKNGEVRVSTFGKKTKTLLTDDDLQDALDSFNSAYDRSNAARSIRAYLDSLESALGGEKPSANDYEKVTDGSRPYWYPADTVHFDRFHGRDLPSVVDDAGVLTSDEEKDLSERIASLKEKYAGVGIDFVIFTDNSSYGLGEAVYSADFYYFNGYGIGEEYTGSVFFLNLDPYDRCWWSAATGGVQYLFDDYENNIEPIDDAIEPYLRDGDYHGAMRVYIERLDSLYEDAFTLPDWYPDDPENYTRVYLSGLPRVVDNAGILTPEQKRSIEARLAALSEQYGIDPVFFTDLTSHAKSVAEYAEDFYYYNGYRQNGFVFCVIGSPDSTRCSWATRSFGNCVPSFSVETLARLNERFYNDAGTDYGNAYSLYLDGVESLFGKGSVPYRYSTPQILFAAALSAIAGAIAGGIALAIAKKGMSNISFAGSAAGYEVPGSFKLRVSRDHHLYTNVTRTRRETSSSSGGRSSSHSGGYHSSGGGSFSGGGRHF